MRIPIVVDCEKDRGGSFDELICHVTYLCTNMKVIRRFEICSTIFFSFNLKFPKAYTSQEDFLKAAIVIIQRCQCDYVIVTLGSTGSFLLRKSAENSNLKTISRFDEMISGTFSEYSHQSDGVFYEISFCPAFQVENVEDTTGAGDTFIAGVCAGVLRQLPIKEMMSLGDRNFDEISASFTAANKICRDGYEGISTFSNWENSQKTQNT